METIQLNTTRVTIEPNDDTTLVTLNNIGLEEIVPQYKAKELLQAIADHYDFSTIADWVTEQLEESDNE